MGEKVKIDPSYYAPDIASMSKEWSDGAQSGEASGITQLDSVFKWMRGFINGWYGWSNDGKGTFFDYLAVVKAMRDDWKFCMFKQEDMSSVRQSNKKIKITANDIYNGLVWTYKGITPYKHVAERIHKPQMILDEYYAAMEWVEKHFFIVYPHDRRFKNVMDIFRFMYENYGIDVFLGDPFKAFILEGEERGDHMMTKVFIEAKEFALSTNTSVNFISHAKSMTDQKEKDGRYKVVNQFMQLGGSAWDINMDGQYSIYRPLRHKQPNDPNVTFFNLKQRKAEIVGCNRGECEGIRFDWIRRRYYFNDICPIDGSVAPGSEKKNEQTVANFFETESKATAGNDDLPF